jgi:AraC-like DNA-binding protein
MKYFSAYVYSDKEVEKAKSNSYIQVNSAGSYWFDESYHPVNHRKKGRNDYLLVYTHSGHSLVRMKEEEYRVKAGTIFIYRPWEEQYYGQIRNESLWCYWIHFSGYGVQELFQKLKLEEQSIIETGVNDYLVLEFEAISRMIFEKGDYFEVILSSMMIQLLHTVARLADFKHIKSQSGEGYNLVHASLNYLYMNYNRKLSVKELADMSGISVGRYINVFKLITQSTPKEYLIGIRIERACELLTNTSMSIKEISYAVGFEDQLYFSRIFKKYKDITPTIYRSVNTHCKQNLD